MYKKFHKKILILKGIYQKPFKLFIFFILFQFQVSAEKIEYPFDWFIGSTHQTQIPIKLSQAFRVGLKNSPSIKIVLSEINKVTKETNIAKSEWYPKINSHFSTSYRDSIESTSPLGLDEFQYGPEVSLTQNLYSFGKINSAIHTAHAEKAAMLAKLAKTQSDVLHEIELAYLKVPLIIQKIQVAEESLNASDQLFQNAEILFKHGTGNQLDILKAKAEKKDRQARLVQLESDLKNAYNELSIAMGIQPDFEYKIEYKFKKTKHFLSKEESTNIAIYLRPEMIMLKKQQEASFYRTQYEWAHRKPNIHAFADYDYTWHDFKTTSDFFNNDVQSGWIAGIKMSVPIFDGFLAKNKALAQEALTDITKHKISKLELKIQHEIHQIYNQVESSLKMVSAQKEAVEAANEAYRLTEISYKEGKSTSTDVILSSLSLSNAKIRFIEANYQIHTQHAHLNKALHNYQPYFSDPL